MLKKMTKLTLCLALALTMLVATAVGAGAVGEYSYADGVLSVYNGSLSGDDLVKALNTIANVSEPQRADYNEGIGGSTAYAADYAAYLAKVYSFSDNGEKVHALSNITLNNGSSYTLYSVTTEREWIQTGKYPWNGEYRETDTYTQVGTFTVRVYDKLIVNATGSSSEHAVKVSNATVVDGKTEVNNATVVDGKTEVKLFAGDSATVEAAAAGIGYNLIVNSDKLDGAYGPVTVSETAETLDSDTVISIQYAAVDSKTIAVTENGATVTVDGGLDDFAYKAERTFTVEYDLGTIESVKVNGEPASAVDGVYTIKNIYDDDTAQPTIVVETKDYPASSIASGTLTNAAVTWGEGSEIAYKGFRTITITPDEGMILKSWSIANADEDDYVVSVVDGKTVITLTNNSTTATTYTVHAEAAYPNVSVTLTGDTSLLSSAAIDNQNLLTTVADVESNADYTVTLTPKDNYYIKQVTVSGAGVAPVSEDNRTLVSSLQIGATAVTLEVEIEPIFTTEAAAFYPGYTGSDVNASLHHAVSSNVDEVTITINGFSFSGVDAWAVGQTVDVVVNYESENPGKYGTTATVSVPLADLRYQPTLSVNDGPFHYDLNKVSPPSDDKLKADMLADFTVSTSVDNLTTGDGKDAVAVARDGYNVTFSYAGDKYNKPATAVQASYTVTENTSSLSRKDSTTAELTAKVGNKEITLPTNLKNDAQVAFTATPKAGTYVSAFKVNGESVIGSWKNGVFTCTLTADADEDYEVEVVVDNVELAFGDVAFNEYYTQNEAADSIKNAAAPSGMLNGATIKYKTTFDKAQVLEEAEAVVAPYRSILTNWLIDPIINGLESALNNSNTSVYVTLNDSNDTNLSLTDVLKALNVDIPDNDLISGVVSALDKVKIPYRPFGRASLTSVELTDTEEIQIDFADDKYLTATYTIKLVDSRQETEVVLQANKSMTYILNEADAKAKILELLSPSVKLKETGSTINADGSISMKVSSLDAGTHDVTVTFAGDEKAYKPSEATVQFTIEKAPVDANVNSQIVEYGKAPKDLITIIPAAPNTEDKVDRITVVAGLGADSANSSVASVIYVDLPEVFGSMELPEMNFGQFIEYIKPLLKNQGLGSDTNNMLDSLVDAFDEVGLTDIRVKLSFGKLILPTESGVYLAGAVTADNNYKTDLGLGYLVIKPLTTEEKLAFNEPDENGLYTLETIGDRDLGSKVETNEALNSKLHNLFIGVDVEGNPVLKLSDAAAADAPRKAGTYTQIAFLLDLGNDVHYAAPIIRQITVVPDLVRIQFTQENPVFTYDGTAKSLTAEVFNKDTGAKINDAANYLTYIYAGIEGDAEGYYGKNKAPNKAGVYTVTAIYNKDNKVYGAAITTMIIKPSDEATIHVENLITTQGTLVDVKKDMVSSSPAEAAKTVITAAVNVSGDFSKQGLGALAGIVNIDLPTRVDELMKAAGFDRTKPIGVDGLRSAISSAMNKVADRLESDQLKEIIKLLDQIPANVNLTFNDDVKYDDIGVYMVIGAITDPDYTLKTASGLLVISPTVTEGELRWNYNDDNGIITRPVLTSDLFDASAYVVGETQPDAELTGKIRYLFFGADANGELLVYTDAAQIVHNGVYLQLAYIYDEISANLKFVKPISRVFAVAPQNVDIAIESIAVHLKDTPYDMAANGKVTVVKRDASPVKLECLSIYYSGVDAEGNVYYSAEPPTAIGEYTVTAIYAETTDTPTSLAEIDLTKIQYAGAGVGHLTVVEDATVLPDDPNDGNTGDEDAVNNALADLPQTGDDSNVMLWMALLSLSAAAVVILLKRKANA